MAQLEPIGRHREGQQVNAIAPSDFTPTTFFSASPSGECKLWDLRLKTKDLVTINVAREDDADGDEEVSECLLRQRTAWVSSGSSVLQIDLRKMATAAAYRHPREVTSTSWNQPLGWGSGSDEIFIGDEDGCLAPLNLATMTVPTHVVAEPDSSFPWNAAATSPPPPIANVCCGVGFTRNPANGTALLASVLMDGHVVSYTTARGSFHLAQATNTMNDESTKKMRHHPSTAKKQTICNPPFPTCATFCRDGCVTVGRADGTYAILDFGESEGDVGGKELSVAFEAPGHESNGLVALHWRGDDLITVAVSGEVSIWRLGPLLSPAQAEAEHDEEAEGELPPLVFAASLRSPGRRNGNAVANCSAAALGGGKLFVGDSDGFVNFVDLDY